MKATRADECLKQKKMPGLKSRQYTLFTGAPKAALKLMITESDKVCFMNDDGSSKQDNACAAGTTSAKERKSGADQQPGKGTSRMMQSP